MKGIWFAVAAVLLSVGCGGNPLAGIVPASPQSVSVQQSDVPSALKPCSAETGDITKNKDASTQKEWTKAQAAGAKTGYLSVFTDTTQECTALAKSTSQSSNAKLLGSIVIQYKDEASATAAYNSGVFGFKPSDFTKQQGATTGTATGLTANSVWATVKAGGQSFSIGIWQNKAFVAFVIAFNVADADAKKAATNMNGRIH